MIVPPELFVVSDQVEGPVPPPSVLNVFDACGASEMVTGEMTKDWVTVTVADALRPLVSLTVTMSVTPPVAPAV